ncbi:aldehyde ferredoxin oxidoreductase C-terminal domain-containing protein [Desulforhopalus singaporensis]|uniref:Aldehyde:ferredoxin oxidoreductase n=1 Tax=Desulforhopalus singaporensis TaxID=91360 RepID=A0A1H0TYR8_9BACT|nr:aldehyde ferredoxin oxidoreductase C-terminal domain-containing protein [Desulforhopalus singaporensis]SDP58686.1 aldehyde:ferredoxin oxidoreductase [Desulforhopalus singaporensis]
MFDILRINTVTEQVERTTENSKRFLLGGRTLSSYLVSEEVPAACEPFGRKNKLFFCNGVLSGTTVSSSNRLSIGGKSPLTGGIKESNAGGIVGLRMAQQGLRTIVLEDTPAPDAPWKIIVIGKDKVEFVDGSFLVGKGVYEKSDLLNEKFGDKAGCVTIGPAGENLLFASGIACSDPHGVCSRYAGRGGLGAVMGAKRIIAMVILNDGEVKAEYNDIDAFRSSSKRIITLLKENPVSSKFTKYGTAAMVDICQSLRVLPTRNFTHGTMDGAEKINAQTMYDTIKERGGEGLTQHACMNPCAIQCSNVYPDKDGKLLCSPIEYETMALMGSNLCLKNLDTVAQMNRLANDAGVDTLDCGAAIGVAMEAGLAEFGDDKAAIAMMEDIRNQTPLGRILGSGCKVAAQVLGVRHAPHVLGQAIPAYEPRGTKGMAMTYLSSPMGADHTFGFTLRDEDVPTTKEGKVALSKKFQVIGSRMDAMGVCNFVRYSVRNDMSPLLDLIKARYDVEISTVEFDDFVKDTLRREHKFNGEAGITANEHRFAETFYEITQPETGEVIDITDEECAQARTW